MRRWGFALLLGLCVVIAVSCARKQAPPKENPLVTSGKELADLLAKEDFAAVVARFDDTMKRGLPQEKLAEAWKEATAQLGPFKKRTGARTQKIQGFDVVFVTCEFENAKADVQVTFDSAARVAGLFIRPAQGPST